MSQLQIADHGAVTVASLRLPQVHTYTISTYPLLISGDTPEIVCLHDFTVQAASRASYQRIRSARPRNMPTNSGSRARVVIFKCEPGDRAIPPRDELIMRAVAQCVIWRTEYDKALLGAGPPGGHETSVTRVTA